LSAKEKKSLEKLLLRGPLVAGYSTDVWTLKRIAEMIQTEFGVHYHPGHVWKLLRDDMGWSCQKPERRAYERDEAAIAHWKRYEWPHIKKRPKTWCPSCISG
jgi:transposase